MRLLILIVLAVILIGWLASHNADEAIRRGREPIGHVSGPSLEYAFEHMRHGSQPAGEAVEIPD